MQSALVFTFLTYLVSWLLWILAAAVLGWDLSRPSNLVVLGERCT